MKIVLNIDEVGQILVNHLCKTGRLENDVVATLTWNIDKFKMQNSYVEIKQ